MHLTAICKNTLVHCYKTVVDALLFRKIRNIINSRFPVLPQASENFEKVLVFKGFSNFSINKRILLRMKLIVLLVFTTFIQVSASTYAQNVTLNEHNASLAKVFSKIKEQTGYLFLYNQEWIAMARKVDIVVNKAPLEEVLNACFSNQPLTYAIVNKTIVLKLKENYATKPVQTAVTAPPVSFPIKGTVNDEKGKPLPGVSVSVKGTKTGTQTDINGTYALNVPDAGGILVFTFIGYERQEVKIGSKTIIDIGLSPRSDLLSEVVVSGYTVQNRAEFTGSSAHIGGKNIENRPLPSFDQALAGQAAGVKITSNGGSLNGVPVFRIRGTNSINLSSYPLIIIDGITSFTGDVGNSAENNPLSTVNTDDIESIEVLKDASATAIYGSRASNGVVVITTKKGKIGKVKVTYDGYYGVTKKPKLPKLLGAADYVTIKDESQVNSGLTPTYFLGKNADGSIQETNWYDYVYQTGHSHNHNLSVSGASESTNYFVSLGYTNQVGFLVKNTFERKSARVNLDHRLIKGLHIGTNFTYGDAINNNLTSGVNNTFGLNNLVRESMVLPPNVLPFNPDGSYNISGSGLGLGPNTNLTGYYNPLPQLQHDKFSSESNNYLGLVYAEWELFKGFKAKTNYSINSLNVSNISFNNPYQAGGYATNGSATSRYTTNYRTDFTNTLNYTTSFANDHHISLLAGYEVIHTVINGFSATRTGLSDPYFESFAGGFTTVSAATGNYTENGYRSYFSNMFYDYKKKYLLSVSFRRDGFSGLSITNKYGNFGGGSIGWNLSEEDFYQKSSLSKTVSSVKLRASYGLVGNVNIGDYASSTLYTPGVYGGVATLALSQTGNLNLKWETSKKTDIGFNIGLWQNRITLDADYYNNNIDGLILAAPQSPSKGIPANAINTNIGSMYNRGFEFDIQAHIIDKGPFRWTAGFNFSTLKNRVTALANNTDIWTSGLETTNITRVGYSVASVYVVKTTGVNPANGLRTYLNRNGETVQYSPVSGAWTYLDGTKAPALDAYGDGVVMGPTLPTYYGGFNNTFKYKNFDLYVNIVYSGGNMIYNGTKATLLDNRFFNNQVDILRRWTTPGQITDIPALHYNDQQASGSVLPNSFNVESDRYVKLGNTSLGYTFPVKLFRKTGISSIRIYGSASNIILYTKYTGSDPEISANGDSNTASGRDKNSVPAGKSFTMGINVGF
ncbi:TonB-linked outer membrane protein, SusC/RagA family [Mucilaginibacter sp. OK268]|nr:TonB-linked outer membrane protein, SusC/RagA family [Mucilaginibacter sp. OK268]